jgi:hypothetical protein
MDKKTFTIGHCCDCRFSRPLYKLGPTGKKRKTANIACVNKRFERLEAINDPGEHFGCIYWSAKRVKK